MVERRAARRVVRAGVDGRLLDQEAHQVVLAERGGEVEGAAAEERLGLPCHRLDGGEVAERSGGEELRNAEPFDVVVVGLGREERVRQDLVHRLGPSCRVALEAPREEVAHDDRRD